MKPARGTPGGVTSAPMVVHRLSGLGGRRGAVHSSGQEEILTVTTVCRVAPARKSAEISRLGGAVQQRMGE